MDRKKIKFESRELLVGNWLKLILFNMATVLVPVVLRLFSISLIANALIGICIVAINYGVTKVYLNFARGEGFRLDNFNCNKRVYLRGYTTSILIGVIQGLGYSVNLICIMLAILAAPHSADFMATIQPDQILAGQASTSIILFLAIGGFAGTIISTWIYAMYALVPYIILEDNPFNDAIITMKYSRNLMRRHKFQLVKLYLSFIGWAILATCISGVAIGLVGVVTGMANYQLILLSASLGSCIVMPYAKTAEARYYINLLEEEKEKVKKMNILG